ncbi:MAG: hypothetical protein U5N86_13795 [Planctomycetota bacterium]|nr:hypothetical protein [Planctomycetota bacterium]
MLRKSYTEIGIGLCGTFWTQDFGNAGFDPDAEPDNTEPLPKCASDLVDPEHGGRRNN